MNLIEQFDNALDQNVRTFNNIFNHNPLEGFSENSIVEIGGIVPGGKRVIIIDNEIRILLDINLKEKKQLLKKKKINKKPNFPKIKKESIKLSRLYKILTPSQFMIYSAIRESKEISGIEELSRNIALTNKTILFNLKPLIKLGLVKKTPSVSKEGSFCKLTIDEAVNIY